MNCTQFNKMLDNYIDGTLLTIQLSHVQSHLITCGHCQKSYTQAKELITALKDIPVPPAKAGYEKRVLSFLHTHSDKHVHKHNGFTTGFSTALAASFALWLFFSPLSFFSDNTENLNTVNLFVQKKQTVDLVFNLAKGLPEATLTIKLPEKIEVAGYAGKRQLSWKTSFKKGANRLALPIISREASSGMLIARLTNNGITKTFRIQINTKQTPTSFFNTNELSATNT